MNIEQLRITVGERLRKARKQQGLSQEDVAKQLDITTGAYGSFERGANLIGLNYLLELSRILQTPVTHFLPIYTLTEAELNDITHDPQFRTFLETWQLLSELADLGDEAGRKAKAALRLQAEVYGNLAKERLKRKKEEE